MRPLDQQTILLTGATDGLGKQTALELAKQGATVLLHGRDQRRLDQTYQEIQAATGSQRLATFRADFAALDEVRQLAADVQRQYPQLDMLINNAGLGGGAMDGTQRDISRDRYELRLAVNYLAPFLLTHLLLPSLRAPARIINVGSVGQEEIDFSDLMLERSYVPLRAYRQSKLALAMFTFDLADELRGTQITVNCLHPASLMNTKMVYESFGYTLSTIADGVRTLMYVATAPELDTVSGVYFDQLKRAHAHPQAYEQAARQQLRQISRQLVGLA